MTTIEAPTTDTAAGDQQPGRLATAMAVFNARMAEWKQTMEQAAAALRESEAKKQAVDEAMKRRDLVRFAHSAVVVKVNELRSMSQGWLAADKICRHFEEADLPTAAETGDIDQVRAVAAEYVRARDLAAELKELARRQKTELAERLGMKLEDVPASEYSYGYGDGYAHRDFSLQPLLKVAGRLLSDAETEVSRANQAHSETQTAARNLDIQARALSNLAWRIQLKELSEAAVADYEERSRTEAGQA